MLAAFPVSAVTGSPRREHWIAMLPTPPVAPVTMTGRCRLEAVALQLDDRQGRRVAGGPIAIAVQQLSARRESA